MAMNSHSTHETLKLVLADMERSLAREQEKRNQRNRWVDGEMEWVTIEREAMLRATNIARAKFDKPAVTIDEIRRIERSAQGHVDYSHKFALGCAFLAVLRKVAGQPVPATG